LSTGSDNIVGGRGNDDWVNVWTAVTVDLSQQQASGDDIRASITGVEGLSAEFSDGPVIFIGNGRANSLFGSIHDDMLSGRWGSDWFFASEGDDVIKGGPGRDATEPGADEGGDGSDDIVGGSGDDLLRGGDNADRLRGSDGNDRLVGGTGADDLEGGTGDDSLNGSGGNNSNDGGLGEDACTNPNPSEGAINCEAPLNSLLLPDRPPL
jgi:Ca2+-binding RTX toxin-like protein